MVAKTFAPSESLRALRIASLHKTDCRTFCQQVNDALNNADFDTWLAEVCRSYLTGADNHSPISLGMYFRLIFISYLKENGYPINTPPGRGTLPSTIEALGVAKAISSRDGQNLGSPSFKLPLEVHRTAFARALQIVTDDGLLSSGNTKFDAGRPALHSWIHKETGEDWSACGLPVRQNNDGDRQSVGL